MGEGNEFLVGINYWPRPVTPGLHREDLEEDRCLGPQEAARFCEILSMHAYPGYTTWADDPLDEKMPLFLGLVTQWLGGKKVLLEEFGVPTEPSPRSLDRADREKMGGTGLVPEEEAGRYSKKVLELVTACGLLGVLFWCFSDYDPALWDSPPLSHRVHERFFGLFRWNGEPKAAARVVSGFRHQETSGELTWDWIDIDRRRYYERPLEHLERLYRNFRDRVQEV